MTKETKLTKKIYTEKALSEWKRVVKDPFHRLEFDTTMRFLKKHLPKKGLILDAGGGPGRYTIELAKMGYNVVLLDLVPTNLELAKKMIKKEKVKDRVKDIVEGSITDLSRFKDNTFDAVLCLGGPLSHVAPEKNRRKAISELIRVSKKNKPIFVSVMGKYGVLMAAPIGWPDEIKFRKHYKRIYTKGDDYMWHGKYYSHFFTSKDLEDIFTHKKNVKVLEKVGLEGLAVSQKHMNKLAENKKAWKNWLEMHYSLCAEPTVVDISGHILIIGRKK